MTSVQERRMIGPHEAAELLQLNRDNRPLYPLKLRAFAKAMRAGEWLDTGVPIIIFRKGVERVLEDGQHRLLAIIDAGVTLAMTISVTDERVFAVVDSGKPRSLGDLIAISEGSREQLTAKRAATVGVAVDRWMRGRPSATEYTNHTNAERLQLLNDYPRDISTLVEIIRKHRRRFGRTPHAGYLAGVLSVFRADQRADRFFDQIYLEDEATVVRGASSAAALTQSVFLAYSKDETGKPSNEQHGQFVDWCRMWNNRVVNAWERREERGVVTIATSSRRWLDAAMTHPPARMADEEMA